MVLGLGLFVLLLILLLVSLETFICWLSLPPGREEGGGKKKKTVKGLR